MDTSAFNIDPSNLEDERNFRIEEVLGKSALETTQLVYIADATGAEHGPYIRKTIDKRVGLGGAYKELFQAQQSGEPAKQLPRILALWETENTMQVIMEHLEGKTLQEAIGGCQTYSDRIRLTAHIFPEACKAVHALHTNFDAPIIHRDLKPSNIMVCPNGIKLIDFGIARVYKQGAERDTKHFGTRPYAPPEQYGFGQTDVRSDVYALGKVLYFCLTGSDPVGDTARDLNQHPEISPELQGIIIHATKLDPASRPKDVRALLNETNAYLKPIHNVNAHQQKKPDAAKQRFKIVGLIWDAILLICSALVVAGAVEATAFPTPKNQRYPLWYLFLSFFLWVTPCILTLFYLISDRRPLRRIIPPLANRSIKSDLIACPIVIAALTLVWIIATLFIRP